MADTSARLSLEELDALILKPGSHPDRSDGLCVMEAAAWVAGETHSDHPACVCPVIGAFMRNWNDSLPDDASRTALLKPLLPVILNTASTKAVETQRSYLALDWLARECAPAWLSLRDDLKAHAVALRGLAPLTDAKTCKAAQPALAAAGAAAGAAGWAAGWDAAGAAGWDAAWTAGWDAGWDAARAAGWDAAWTAGWDAARAAAGAAGWTAGWAAVRAAAWTAGWDAARAAGWDAVGAALAPTVTLLQQSASDLVRRMADLKALP